jgi:hypothetical protein
MNDLVFAQLYYKEIEDKLLREQSDRQLDEETKRANFVSINKKFRR